jgi:hypothetical protein
MNQYFHAMRLALCFLSYKDKDKDGGSAKTCFAYFIVHVHVTA